MHRSPAGRLGETSVDGPVGGRIGRIVRSEVPADVDGDTDPNPPVIFPNAVAGRAYRIQADCPTDDCWGTSAGDSRGPDGDLPLISFPPFHGMNVGTLAVKMPGVDFWYKVGSTTRELTAFADGDIIASFADFLFTDNVGAMPVIVEELGEGPVDGELDFLETITIEGTGGAFPGSGTFGITLFESDNVPYEGVIVSIDSLVIEGLTHTFTSDVTLRLQSPTGREAIVFERVGVATIDADANFDGGDYTFTNDSDTPYDFEGEDLVAGTYRSQENLTDVMLGADVIGRWHLNFADASPIDTGSFTSWRMTAKIALRARSDFVVAPDPLEERIIKGYTADVFEMLEGFDTAASWPGTPPSDPVAIEIIVPNPGRLVKIRQINFADFEYSPAEYIHMVLFAPSGNGVTVVHRPGSTSGGAGNPNDFSIGAYIFQDVGTIPSDSATIMPGTYGRDPGDWPGGALPLGTFDSLAGERIEGKWTLAFYDWGPSAAFTSSIGFTDDVTLVLEFVPD